jgi:phosphoglycolate phosphatase
MAFDTMVFDLDGTLVDTAMDLSASLNHALLGLGRPPVAPGSVRAMVGQGARRLLEHGLATSGPATPDLVEAGFGPFLDHYAANIARHSRPFDDVEPVLDRLAAGGHRLAICTNKPAHLTHRLLEALGWTERFAAVLGADSRPWRKPDPRHLLDTIAEAGGGRAVFVGDSRTDAETARNAGVPLILVSFGYSMEPVAGLGADRLIHGFAELPEALDDLARQRHEPPAVQGGFKAAAPTRFG